VSAFDEWVLQDSPGGGLCEDMAVSKVVCGYDITISMNGTSHKNCGLLASPLSMGIVCVKLKPMHKSKAGAGLYSCTRPERSLPPATKSS